MKFSQIKDELKKTLKLLLADQSQQLQISDLSVGGKVEIINADGSLSPAPDGEYQVDDNSIVVKDGQIVSVNGQTDGNTNPDGDSNPVQEEMKNPTPETPAEEAAETPADDAKEENDTTNKLESMQAEIDALKAIVKSWQDAQTEKDAKDASEQKMSADVVNELNTLNQTIKTLIGIPAEFSKTSKSNIVADSKDEKLKEYARIIAATKK